MGTTLESQVDEVMEPGAALPEADAADAGPPATEAPPTRRGFLAAAAALALAGRGAQAQQRVPAPQAPATGGRGMSAALARVAAPPDLSGQWQDPVARLVRRITLGINKEELDRAKQLGYTRYLEEQLRPSRIDDRACSEFVAQNYQTLAMKPEALYAADYGRVQNEMQEATLYRAAFSKRQLFERMVEFWSDHFNIARQDVGYLKTIDDRDVIRRHALGSFPAMLRASAHSAAMMEYLDQTRSSFRSPNQNYAREIMELHSVGVNGGYTQDDVAELSKVFTGWTISGRGIFMYDASLHDFTAKTVMGQTFPAATRAGGLAGKAEAERFIEFLATHPRTANYLATKLAKFMLQYEPPQAVIDAAASAFTRSRGDIPSMLRVILDQRTLMASQPKYKRPFHFAVSAVRALGPTVTSMQMVRGQVDNMGHSIFAWETPDGYPDKIEFWSGLVMQRFNAAQSLSNGSGTAFVVTPASFRAATAEATADLIIERLFGGEVPAAFRTKLADYVRPALASDTRIREALALAMSSSQFQWY
ncbi:MAG: DUF1800 domain-containing protein [Gemmatimonadaceae bacterium]|nr:DUF1800 domain-containing protein [Gemmatimonadaceae bacterium]